MEKLNRTVPRNIKRDVLIAVATGLAVLGFIFYAIAHVSKVPEGYVRGRITHKVFKPQKEQQISIGRKGLRERELDGEYIFEIEVPKEGKTFTVWVDKYAYRSYSVGDKFTFKRPEP